MNALVGGMPDAARFVFAFLVALGLFAAVVLVWRRFGGGVLLTTTGSRGRQPRLAVIDATQVDARRRLILIRRDNTEHLLMIGGPTDIVVESSINRGSMTGGSREARPLPTGELAARPDGPLWSPLGEISRSGRMTDTTDPMRAEPIAARPDPLRSGAVRADSLRPEVVRSEPTRPDSADPEVLPAEMDREDDVRHEPSLQDVIRQEASPLELRQASARREMSRQEATRESIRQDANRRDTSAAGPVPLETRPARERLTAEPTRMSRPEPTVHSPQLSAVEQNRSDFAEELTRAMSHGEQMPLEAEVSESKRPGFAPTVQQPSRAGALTGLEAPTNAEAKRVSLPPSTIAPPPQVAPEEMDLQSTVQPQRIQAPTAPKEGGLQSTGAIRESPTPRATPPRPSQADENNLAEMAQRLEVALRRPTRPAEAAPTAARPAARIEPLTAPPRPTASLSPASRTAIASDPSVAGPPSGMRMSQPAPVTDLRADARMRPVQDASAPFESLEEEMANLLGRSTGKT